MKARRPCAHCKEDEQKLAWLCDECGDVDLVEDEPAGADLLDPRQRQAACLLLSAIDLPANAHDWALQLAEAAAVFPGALCDQAALNSRKAGLERARALIDAMLGEIA